MATGIPSRCVPNVPFKEWARDKGLPGGELDYQNWLYFEQFIQNMLENCVNSLDDIEWSYTPLITTVELNAWFPRASMTTVKFRAIAYIEESG